MQILVVEDELLIAEMLKEMLTDLGHTVVSIAKSYEQAVSALKDNPILDFCFLDINLKTIKTGLDIAAIINDTYKIPFVFLTSYSDKATIANAMAYQPQAYLIKPFTEVDLFTTIALVNSRQQQTIATQEPETIFIKDGTAKIKLIVNDILWLKSDNIYVEIKTIHKTYLIRNSLVQFLDEIATNRIERVHRTFAVNMKNVNAISGQYLIIGETKIPFSRKYREEIKTKFQ